MKNKMWFLIFSVLLSIFINWRIYQDNYSFFLVILWLLSILSLIGFSFTKSMPLSNFINIQISRNIILLFFLILLPTIVRIFNYDLNRIHTDDLLTAYFSAHYDLINTNFFSVAPTDKGQWVSQFPTLYFVLQKLFFKIFGASLLTVKLSITPYVFIVSLTLFLITKRILNQKSAVISVIIISFLAPSLYLETMGLHFISSAAIFLLFFYFLILFLEKKKLLYSSLSGISCGLSYLFYTSSYIALPILVLFFIAYLILNKNHSLIVKNFLMSIAGFLIVVTPFLSYMHTAKNYYLTQRINQVNLVSGGWSHQKEEIEKGKNPLRIISENLLVATKSLYYDGIGGHGGYTFNRLAFFNKFTLFLFLVGAIASLILAFRKIELLIILTIIIISFITGVVLTIPPPAYHRLSISYPFLAIVMAVPFYAFLSLKKFKVIKIMVVSLILIVYSVSNQISFMKMVQESQDTHHGNFSLKIAQYINQNFSDRTIYVAAFTGFAFNKIFYFVNNDKQIYTDYHNNLLRNFNHNQKYLYVIIFPDEFDKKFLAADKNGKIVRFSESYSLFSN